MERPLDTLGNKKNIRKSISLGQYCQKKFRGYGSKMLNKFLKKRIKYIMHLCIKKFAIEKNEFKFGF